MFSGTENWSTGFFLGNRDATAGVPNQEAVDTVRDLWETFMETALVSISNRYTFTACKMASLADTGHTIEDEVVYSYPTTTVTGANGTATLPPQCSLVATLTTVRPRGRASKGRMYLPGIAATIDANGKINSVTRGAIADALKTFFDSINGNFNMPGKVILASEGVGLLPALTAQNEWVTGLRVGDVIDTQRRRRNGLVELYTLRDLAA